MSEQHSTKARPACPTCGSDKVTQILYGLPSYDTWQKAERGEIVLGGCVIFDDAPRWACLTCRARFNFPSENGADLTNPN